MGGKRSEGGGPQVRSRTGRRQGPGSPGVIQLEPPATLDVCLAPTMPPTWGSRADMEHSCLSISPQSPSEQNAWLRGWARRLSFHLNTATSSPQTPREPGLLPLAASPAGPAPTGGLAGSLSVLLLPDSQQPSWGWSTAIWTSARLGQPITARAACR